MTFTVDLVTAVAESLHVAGLALFVSPWPDAPTLPVVSVASTPDRPEQIVTLSPYGVDDTVDEHSTIGLQVRCRGGRDPRVAYGIDDAVFEVLHRPLGASFGTTAPVLVVQSYRASGPAPLGADQSGRFELTSNYYLIVSRASIGPWA